jgi:hypothetical protein
MPDRANVRAGPLTAGDWLLIPPDTPHQPKPDPGGFSYFIMKINVGVYPWSLIR